MTGRGKKKFEDYGISWKCKLKVYRAEFELTQDQVAHQLNVSRQTISSIEKGKYNPSLILAYKVAKLFNVSIEDIFVFEPTNS